MIPARDTVAGEAANVNIECTVYLRGVKHHVLDEMHTEVQVTNLEYHSHVPFEGDTLIRGQRQNLTVVHH